MYAGRNSTGNPQGYEVVITIQPDEFRAAEKILALATVFDTFEEPTYHSDNLRTIAKNLPK